jgi:hypothetical protein
MLKRSCHRLRAHQTMILTTRAIKGRRDELFDQLQMIETICHSSASQSSPALSDVKAILYDTSPIFDNGAPSPPVDNSVLINHELAVAEAAATGTTLPSKPTAASTTSSSYWTAAYPTSHSMR